MSPDEFKNRMIKSNHMLVEQIRPAYQKYKHRYSVLLKNVRGDRLDIMMHANNAAEDLKKQLEAMMSEEMSKDGRMGDEETDVQVTQHQGGDVQAGDIHE